MRENLCKNKFFFLKKLSRNYEFLTFKYYLVIRHAAMPTQSHLSNSKFKHKLVISVVEGSNLTLFHE